MHNANHIAHQRVPYPGTYGTVKLDRLVGSAASTFSWTSPIKSL